MDLRRVRPADWLTGLAGVAVLALLWAPWYTATGGDLSAWEALTVVDLWLALTALLAIAVPVVTAARDTPAIPVALDVVCGTVAVLAVVLVAVRLAWVPAGDVVTRPAWGAAPGAAPAPALVRPGGGGRRGRGRDPGAVRRDLVGRPRRVGARHAPVAAARAPARPAARQRARTGRPRDLSAPRRRASRRRPRLGCTADAQPRPGHARRPPRTPGAERRGARALRRRAVEGRRLDRQDRRAPGPRGRRADLARRHGGELPARRRAAAEPARRAGAGLRARQRRRGLPGAEPGRGIGGPVVSEGELLALTGAQAAERVRAGDLDAGELWRFYRDRCAADDLNAFVWVSDAADPEEVPADGPLAGVPIGI